MFDDVVCIHAPVSRHVRNSATRNQRNYSLALRRDRLFAINRNKITRCASDKSVPGIRPHRATPQLEQDGEKNNKEIRQFLHYYCEENLTKRPLFIPALPGKRNGKCLPRLIAIFCSVEPMEKSILVGGLKSAVVS
jgi:hypothetical protein